MKDKIDFIEFLEIEKKLEIKIGKVVKSERIPKNKKMLVLSVNFGGEDISVVTNIGSKIEPEILLNKKFAFVTNLKPAIIAGYPSEAMIIIPTHTDGEMDLTESPLAGSILI